MIINDNIWQIPIRGEDKTWEYVGKGSKEGKQRHMASAAQELVERHGVMITRSSTILLDDDPQNIKIALDNQVKAVRLNPKNPDVFPFDLLEASSSLTVP